MVRAVRQCDWCPRFERGRAPCAALCIAVAAIVTVACGERAVGRNSAEALGERHDSIVGGRELAPGDWPSVVRIGDICTGFVVSPRVVLYAAHCGQSVRTIENEERAFELAECHVFPQGADLSRMSDVAYCVLEEPFDGPVLPIRLPCEPVLEAGQEVLLLGNGMSMDGGQFGSKRAYFANIAELNGELAIASPDATTCLGDSGGPVLARNSAGFWSAVGVISAADDAACARGMVTYATLLPPFVPWLEAETGMDVAPCLASDGEWDPTPDCGWQVADSEARDCAGCERHFSQQAASVCGAARIAQPEDELEPKLEIVVEEDLEPKVRIVVEEDAATGIVVGADGYTKLEFRIEVAAAPPVRQVGWSLRGPSALGREQQWRGSRELPPFEVSTAAVGPGKWTLEVVAETFEGRTKATEVSVEVFAQQDELPKQVNANAGTACSLSRGRSGQGSERALLALLFGCAFGGAIRLRRRGACA